MNEWFTSMNGNYTSLTLIYLLFKSNILGDISTRRNNIGLVAQKKSIWLSIKASCRCYNKSSILYLNNNGLNGMIPKLCSTAKIDLTLQKYILLVWTIYLHLFRVWFLFLFLFRIDWLTIYFVWLIAAHPINF